MPGKTDDERSELTPEKVQQLRETVEEYNRADPDQLRPSWEDLSEPERHAGLTYLRRRLREQGSPTWVTSPDGNVCGIDVDGHLLSVFARDSPLYGVRVEIDSGDGSSTNRYRAEWWRDSA